MRTLLFPCLLLLHSLVVLSFGFQGVYSRDGGNHTCTRKRLTRLSEALKSHPLHEWPCEEYFSAFSCERIRLGIVSPSEVFYPRAETVCCPGSYRLPDGQCQTPCPAGLYGPDCQLVCSCVNAQGTCDAEDGQCHCNEGWTGRDCDQRCPPGYYGRNCQDETLPCLNGGTNDPHSGICLCPVTHQGEHCEQECVSQSCKIDCMKCSLPGAQFCDSTISVCRCKSGWTGQYCTEPCPVGLTGPFCSETCCSRNGIYIPETKSCKCNDGYQGDDCEETCEPGKYGPRCALSCDFGDCNHVTGASEACPAGFTGDSCTNSCPGKTWGLTCNRTCSCDPGEECDVFSGDCKKRGKVAQLQEGAADKSFSNATFSMTGTLAVVGGAVFLSLIILAMFVSTKCMVRKRHQEMESKAFPSLSSKQETKAMVNHEIDFIKEDTNSLYQEIDEYPSRYTKPALPSAPPGIPNDTPQYERVLTNFDPDYLIPDVK